MTVCITAVGHEQEVNKLFKIVNTVLRGVLVE